MGEKTVLLTGFEPFHGEEVNPSWEAVRALPDEIGGWRVEKLLLPTEFDTAAALALQRAEEVSACAVISTGEAGGRAAVTPEVVAINLQDASIPDNAGKQPQDRPVVPGGETAYFSTLPVKRIVKAVREAGLPCQLSYSAGTYVCNDVFYRLLRRFAGTGVPAGFIHVPFLPQQAKNGEFSLPADQTARALEAAVRALQEP